MNQKNRWIGRQVRASRLRRKLTLAELARKAELTAPELTEIEEGRCGVSIDTLRDLEWYLDARFRVYCAGGVEASG